MSVDDEARLLALARWPFLSQDPNSVGVAVSGGSDSVALLHLTWRAAAATGAKVFAVTVDHTLRPESGAEAQGVSELCEGLGVPHDVLVWRHGDIAGNLPDQARRARYDLIAGWARDRGIGHVGLGHTMDDQAETVLIGLARAAGVDGLSGMRLLWQDRGLTWARPLLTER